MIIGIVKETFPGERRVALVPNVIPNLTKAKLEVLIEPGAGQSAGYPDDTYHEKGARIAADRNEVLASADILLQVRAAGANPEAGQADLDRLRAGQVVIGMLDPLWDPPSAKQLAERQVAAFALELLPRITRAQSMDVLSSMATIAGYKAVLLAAGVLPKMYPMMMTAAGSIAPAKVFVVGAGVAGLQAIATTRRLGAVVRAYDVRPAVKEEVQSLGAKFVELGLESEEGGGKGGYAKAMGDEFYRRQREVMTNVVAESDVVITTAAIPGKKSPVLITADMVKAMAPGSVIVDLAAERGGNCELTQPDQTVVEHGVTILGPINLPATIPFHASQMYAKNISTFLLNLVKDGQLNFNMDDEIIRDTLVCRDGKVVLPRVLELLKSQ